VVKQYAKSSTLSPIMGRPSPLGQQDGHSSTIITFSRFMLLSTIEKKTYLLLNSPSTNFHHVPLAQFQSRDRWSEACEALISWNQIIRSFLELELGWTRFSLHINEWRRDN
jgi:hypothetical protein